MPRRLASRIFDISTLEPPPPTSRLPIATRIVSAENGRCSSMPCRSGRRRCVEGVWEMPRTIRFVRIRPRARLRAQIPCPRDDLRKLSKVHCEGVGFHAHAPSGVRHGLPARASAGRWFKCSRSLHMLGPRLLGSARTEVLRPLRAAALPLCHGAPAAAIRARRCRTWLLIRHPRPARRLRRRRRGCQH